MKIISDDRNQSISDIRCKMSRQRLQELGHFADSLSALNLTHAERDIKRAVRMHHAAKLCITRGHLQVAQKLLTRSYSTACRLEQPALAASIAASRVELENIMRNSNAMRLWMTRRLTWEKRSSQQIDQRYHDREQFYSTVICTPVDCTNSHYDEYVCQELRHVIPLYDYCALGLYDHVLTMLDSPRYKSIQSVYLYDELRWLRFRLHCSTQRYEIATALLEEMQNKPPSTTRLREYVLLGTAYMSLQRQLYPGADTTCATHPRLSTFLNTFTVVSYELAGLHLSVYVYELVRLILEGKHVAADKRLAALRSRAYRQRAHGNLQELKLFLRVAGYILATSHRCKRTIPRQLLAAFHERTLVVPYAQQGIVAYSELAFRLFRYLGYR